MTLRDLWLANDWTQLSPEILAIARRALFNRCTAPDDIDDVAQYVLVECWSREGVPDFPDKFVTVAARNRWMRTQKYHFNSRRVGVEAALEIESPVTVSNLADENELRQLLLEKTAAWKKWEADLFLMRVLCQYPYPEIERRLERTFGVRMLENQLRVRMRRLCRRLLQLPQRATLPSSMSYEDLLQTIKTA